MEAMEGFSRVTMRKWSQSVVAHLHLPFPLRTNPIAEGGLRGGASIHRAGGSEVPISSTSVSLLLSGDPLAYSGHNDFHPTVFSASGGCVICRDGLFLAVAPGGD